MLCFLAASADSEMAVLSALDKSEQIFMETFYEAHGQEFTTVYAPKGDE